MVISGNTRLIAHLGYPTASFKAPMIYNPWFVDQQVDVKVVPMGVRPEDYAAFIPPLFTMTNIIGALVTMPHKIATCDLVQRLSPTAAIAGACNAIRREASPRRSAPPQRRCPLRSPSRSCPVRSVRTMHGVLSPWLARD